MERETSDPKSWQWTAADRLFLELLRKAHARGMRVILDGVFNHTGRDFFAFRNLREKQEASPYKEWYTVEKYDDPATPANEFKYKCWWGVDTLPEFADDAATKDLGAGPKAYVLDITRRWMDPDGDGNPADGIDGWRLDVAREVPVAFWRDWHALVQSINPEAYTVAEEWDEASRFLDEGAFDATMNYYGFSFPTKGYLIDSTLLAGKAAKEFADRLEDHPAAMRYAMLNLVDSHDTDRLASMIVNGARRAYQMADRFDYDIAVSPRQEADYDVRKPDARERRIQRMVALLQMTYVGAPMIWYGTEVGMWGSGDPNNRKPMLWTDLQPYAQADENHVMEEQLAFYKQAIALRGAHPALRTGSFRTVLTDDAQDVWVFLREGEGEQVLVALNAAGKPATIALPESLGTGWKPVFGEVAAGVPDAAFPKVGIPTESGRVWVRAIK
jgi:glycosidase